MESIKELRIICQKPAAHLDNWFMKNFSRRISIYFTKIFLLLGITANQVTLISLVIGLIGATLFFTGKLTYLFVGSLLIIFGYVLDACDGEVARYCKTISFTGVHIDQFMHQLLSKFVYFGLAFGVYLNTQKLSVLIFGFLCAIFSTSIVLNTMSVELVKIGIRSKDKKYNKRYGDKKKYNKNITNISGMSFGETKGKLNFLYKISNTIKFLWTDPYDKLIILSLVVIEIINIKILFFSSFFLLYYFIVIYSILFTLVQLFSFIVHIRSKTIEQYYSYLFEKK